MSSSNPKYNKDAIEDAGNLVNKYLKLDHTFYELSGLLRVATHSKWVCPFDWIYHVITFIQRLLMEVVNQIWIILC